MNGYMYKSGLGLMEPVAVVGQNVAINYLGKIHYKRVQYVEAIPPFQFLDIGAIAAATVSLRTSGANLQLADDEWGQFRWYPLDNAQVRLWLPQAQGKYTLLNIQSVVDNQIVQRDPCLHLTEFYVWQDNNPWFEAINFADYALTACRLIAQGYRFFGEDLEKSQVEAIKSGREGCTPIMASGKHM
jgi:hypothetical protein